MNTPIERIAHAKRELERYIKDADTLEKTAIHVADQMWAMGKDVCDYDMLELVEPRTREIKFLWVKGAKKAANDA